MSRVIFDTLYLLMSFGHDSPEEAARLDPPLSYFRIRLICTLLETCGQFFNKGLAKKRLDRVLAYFQRYLLAKPPLPLDVEFDVQVCSSIRADWLRRLCTLRCYQTSIATAPGSRMPPVPEVMSCQCSALCVRQASSVVFHRPTIVHVPTGLAGTAAAFSGEACQL